MSWPSFFSLYPDSESVRSSCGVTPSIVMVSTLVCRTRMDRSKRNEGKKRASQRRSMCEKLSSQEVDISQRQPRPRDSKVGARNRGARDFWKRVSLSVAIEFPLHIHIMFKLGQAMLPGLPVQCTTRFDAESRSLATIKPPPLHFRARVDPLGARLLDFKPIRLSARNSITQE